MSVLVYCPLNPQPPRAYARTLQSIFALAWNKPFEIVFGRDDAPKTPGYDNLTEKHNRARKMALDGGYDGLLLVEADMIVPPDALAKLAAMPYDVCYGLYCSRHGTRQWLAYSEVRRVTGKSIERDRRACSANWGKVVVTAGVGLGCTLIRRHVLEALEFRREASGCADDWYFALDCTASRFRQAHHLGVVCGHIDNETIIWPAITRSGDMHELERL